MPRSLGQAIGKLRRVRCPACDREFLSNARPPRLCPGTPGAQGDDSSSASSSR